MKHLVSKEFLFVKKITVFQLKRNAQIDRHELMDIIVLVSVQF